MKPNHYRPSIDVRLRAAGRVGALTVQHDVPVFLTGAEWRALGATLSPDGRMSVRLLFQYVTQLVDRDLRARGIEHQPLVVREYLEEVRQCVPMS